MEKEQIQASASVPWMARVAVAVSFGFGLVGAGFSVIFPLTLSAAGRASRHISGTAISTVASREPRNLALLRDELLAKIWLLF